jgi:mono/diheme cytochrome c family protein
MGAPIDFAPLHPLPVWADRSPSLAGLPSGYSEAQLATFLETGRKPNGGFARPPMPAFRMSPADAHAVAAYLRSLAPGLPQVRRSPTA